MKCDLCGGATETAVAGPPLIVRCRRCGVMRLAEFLGREARGRLYQEDYYTPETADRFLGLFERIVLFFRWLRVRDLQSREPGPASLLDVGCGRGVLLELLAKRGWDVLGTQVSRSAAEAAGKRRGVKVVLGELPEIQLPPRSFRVVTFYHVLEHLADPVAYLDSARRLLEDSGLLVVEVPNHAGAGFRTLGSRHFCVDHPNHLFFYTPRTLGDLLGRHGFEVVKISRFSLEYSPFTTLQNLLNAIPGQPNRLYRSFMHNPEGAALRRRPLTWLHALLALFFAAPALLVSLSALVLPGGNTFRCYCRKKPAGGTSRRGALGEA